MRLPCVELEEKLNYVLKTDTDKLRFRFDKIRFADK